MLGGKKIPATLGGLANPDMDIKSILLRVLQYLVISVAVAYVADLIVFQVRLARGTGMNSIPVEQYLATPLKGNKAEYDYMGMANEACSRSIFPQYSSSVWNPACWWLRRHPARWQ
jgi:hypothetical protein